MGVTIRVVRGRKAKNSQRVIRRSIKVHVYDNDSGVSIRTRKSTYIGSSKNTSQAKISIDTSSGTRTRYVSIT